MSGVEQWIREWRKLARERDGHIRWFNEHRTQEGTAVAAQRERRHRADLEACGRLMDLRQLLKDAGVTFRHGPDDPLDEQEGQPRLPGL